MAEQDTNSLGAETLGSDVNKLKKQDPADNKTGVVSEKLPELSLSMKDEDIIKLVEKWQKDWDESPKKQEWLKACDENEKYWKGQQFDTPKADKSRPNVDNLIFESVETYLPMITRRNPEPLVALRKSEEKTPESNAYVLKVKDTLGEIADENKLRLKLKRAARHWAMYLMGVGKAGWDLDKNIPILRVVRPKKVILDPDAWNDEDGYTGNRIGELRKMEAGKLLSIMGDKAEEKKVKVIKDAVKDNNMATELQFIEWWTDEYMCWIYEKEVILKVKNPHWNYDRTEQPNPAEVAAPGVEVDDYGNTEVKPVEIKGINHFAHPKKPYIFLTVFNLGDQPMDNTSLIGQNLANQDRINKRNKQIDQNADNANNGVVVSLERSGLTMGEAKTVTQALRKGGVITIPTGNPQEAVYRPTAPNLPADIFNDRNDTRERMRDIFGTRGSSAAGIQSEQTVRGKIIARGTDTDRIGGGVSEYLEQFADDVYNWFYQLLLVYGDDFIFPPGVIPPRITLSVKEGSLLPKDSTTIANQAIELGTTNKMALIDMYERLEYPNPEKLAANVWLEVNAPEILYADDPRIAQAIQAKQQAAMQAEASKMQAEKDKMAMKGELEMNKAAMKNHSGDPLAEVPIEAGVT